MSSQAEEVPVEVEVSIEVVIVGETGVPVLSGTGLGLNPVLSAWPCSLSFTYSLLPQIFMSVFGILA